MLNNQPQEPRAINYKVLYVFDIWKTIQGEGPFSGQRAVFVRLSGCNLNCHFCDTDYTSKRQPMSFDDIVQEVKKVEEFDRANSLPLVVITGGEPLRQNILPLLVRLVDSGYYVQIETNGTYDFYIDNEILAAYGLNLEALLDDVAIVCCPKTVRIHPNFTNRIDCYKYVIDADHIDEEDGLPSKILGTFRPARPPKDIQRDNIFVTPMDVDDKDAYERNVKAAAQSALKFGYTFQLQIHKYAGLQ